MAIVPLDAATRAVYEDVLRTMARDEGLVVLTPERGSWLLVDEDAWQGGFWSNIAVDGVAGADAFREAIHTAVRAGSPARPCTAQKLYHPATGAQAARGTTGHVFYCRTYAHLGRPGEHSLYVAHVRADKLGDLDEP